MDGVWWQSSRCLNDLRWEITKSHLILISVNEFYLVKLSLQGTVCLRKVFYVPSQWDRFQDISLARVSHEKMPNGPLLKSTLNFN